MKRIVIPGFFDGVHTGHGRLFKIAAEKAEALGAGTCALTYDTHPKTVLTGRTVPLLCSPEERAALIKARHRISEVIIDPFTKDTSDIPWKEYIDRVLIGRLSSVHIVAGHDYIFGREGKGSADMLSYYCQSIGVGCTVVPPEKIGGVRVSSTYIRGLVSEGDMELAARFLGRRYSLSGTVGRGKGLGRKFGFPTANIPLPAERQTPEWGVYATYVIFGGNEYPAVTNVGIRPSVENGGAPAVESTLLNFDGDLYGKYITVEFERFMRPERRFASVEALTEQVRMDMDNAHSRI
jgi:riboflavin kinase/FMN adenylyltransferase